MKTCLVCAAEHEDAEPTCAKCGEASWSEPSVVESPASVAVVEDTPPMSKRGGRR